MSGSRFQVGDVVRVAGHESPTFGVVTAEHGGSLDIRLVDGSTATMDAGDARLEPAPEDGLMVAFFRREQKAGALNGYKGSDLTRMVLADLGGRASRAEVVQLLALIWGNARTILDTKLRVVMRGLRDLAASGKLQALGSDTFAWPAPTVSSESPAETRPESDADGPTVLGERPQKTPSRVEHAEAGPTTEGASSRSLRDVGRELMHLNARRERLRTELKAVGAGPVTPEDFSDDELCLALELLGDDSETDALRQRLSEELLVRHDVGRRWSHLFDAALQAMMGRAGSPGLAVLLARAFAEAPGTAPRLWQAIQASLRRMGVTGTLPDIATELLAALPGRRLAEDLKQRDRAAIEKAVAELVRVVSGDPNSVARVVNSAAVQELTSSAAVVLRALRDECGSAALLAQLRGVGPSAVSAYDWVLESLPSNDRGPIALREVLLSASAGQQVFAERALSDALPSVAGPAALGVLELCVHYGCALNQSLQSFISGHAERMAAEATSGLLTAGPLAAVLRETVQAATGKTAAEMQQHIDEMSARADDAEADARKARSELEHHQRSFAMLQEQLLALQQRDPDRVRRELISQLIDLVDELDKLARFASMEPIANSGRERMLALLRAQGVVAGPAPGEAPPPDWVERGFYEFLTPDREGPILVARRAFVDTAASSNAVIRYGWTEVRDEPAGSSRD